MSDKSKTIIIKKVKKGHAAHHGGSWKVAYADFVTAMMAFFLLMWLLSMSTAEQRIRLSQYFKEFSIFKTGGSSLFMDQSGQIKQETGGDISVEDKGAISKGVEEVTAQDLQEKLKKAVHSKLQGMDDRIVIEITDEGVRIQITDPDGILFLPGSAQPTAKAKDILKVLSENLRDMPNKLAVEGHTDTSGSSTGKTTNWELSSARAAAARQELEANGLDYDRIARVVGFADRDLFVRDDPEDPKNRRISILVLPANALDYVKPSSEIKRDAEIGNLKIIGPKMTTGEKVPQQKKEVFDMGVKPKKPIEFENPVINK